MNVKSDTSYPVVELRAEGLPAPEAVLHLIGRRWKLLATFLALALALAWAYVKITPPTYSASAKILIGAPSGFGDASADAGGVDSAQVESQVEILRASIIAVDVIRKLNLVADPEFLPDPSAPTPREAALAWLSDYVVNHHRLQGAVNDLQTALARPPVKRTPEENLNIALGSFADRIGVRRLGQADVVEIDFSANSPEKAARVVTAIVNSYLSGIWRAGVTSNAMRRFTDDVMRKASVVTNARVISGATPPLGKSSPKTALILGFAAALGLFVGLVVAVWLEARRVETAGEAKPRRGAAGLREAARRDSVEFKFTDLP